MSFKRIALALTCLALVAALPATASASSGQLALFQDDSRLVESGGSVQTSTLDEIRGLGADVVKVHIQWSAVAPGTKRKPSGFDASSPSGYSWGLLDSLVTKAQARGFQVMLAPTGPAPGWATARRGDRSGVDRIKPKEYGKFVEAAARRFPGVRSWVFLNEPNHPRFLYPQSVRGVPYAPHLYRRLVASGVAGLKRAGHRGDRVLFGEMLPIGKPRLTRRNSLKPLRFLREMFCVDSHWRRFHGRAAKKRGCNKFRRITGVTGFGYHPYTRPNGPRGREPSRDDATIRSFRRITRTLDRARRKHRLGGPARMKVWNTEFGYQSNPPDPFQTRLRRIPGFLNEAEWISFRNRRVASWSQYTLVDTKTVHSRSPFIRYSTWQGGLRYSSGKAKRGVYGAYRLPIFVRLLGPRAVEVWGDARPGGAGSRVQIQQRAKGGRYANLETSFVVSNARGYFRKRIRISKASRRVYRFKAGGFTSRAAKAAFR